jgi:energy-coupling factor transporter ATP-binding protein EcfA2
MEAIGFPVYRFKLVAFTLAGALAGLAGALLANQGGFVSPSMMQWSQSGMLMVMVILGGVGIFWWPGGRGVVSAARRGADPLHHPLAVGSGRRAAGRGAAGTQMSLLAKPDQAAEPDTHERGHRPHFAVDGWSSALAAWWRPTTPTLEVRQGTMHALIGPNGAGKTTLIHQISGALRPDEGGAFFGGQDITAMPMHRAHASVWCARTRSPASSRPPVGDGQHGSRGAGPQTAAACSSGAPRAQTVTVMPRRLCWLGRWVWVGVCTDRGFAVAWRAAPAGARSGTGHAAQVAAARRADGRHGSGRGRAHARPAAGLARRADHSAGRARHGCCVSSGRHDFHAGFWAGDCQRAPHSRSATTPRSGVLTWVMMTWLISPRQRTDTMQPDPTHHTGNETLLEIEGLRAAYGSSQVLFGHQPANGCGRDCYPAGAQRHGQDDHSARHFRIDARHRRLHAFSVANALTASRPTASGAWAWRWYRRDA